MVRLFLRPLGVGAQSTCESTYGISLTYSLDPSEPGPIGFDMCDLFFDVTLEFTHEYQEAHEYVVSITYDPQYFNLLGTTPAWSGTPSVQFDNDGNVVVTGVYEAPFVDEVLSIVQLVLHFERLDRWESTLNGGIQRITYTLSDPDCSPTLLDTFDPPLFCAAYFDLRNPPSNTVSGLIGAGWFLPCSPSAPSGGNVLIADELIVDQDFCFINTTANAFMNLAFLPGAKIIVESGNTLLLRQMQTFTCGPELAQGIIVEPGATLIVDECILSDSRFAIDAKPGSRLAVTTTDFNDNYIGAHFNMTDPPFRVTIDSFEGNDFTTLNGVKQPFAGMPEAVEFRGYCGIYLKEYMDFNVFGNNLPSVPDGNFFSLLANGIIAYNSTINIGNMHFSDMNSVGAAAYPMEGYGIRLQAKNAASWINVNRPGCPP